MNTPTFQSLLDAFPSSLRKRILDLEKIDQREDFHPEGNVLNHTKIVYQRARKFGNTDLMLAAIFHDIGKDETTTENGNAFGHEKISTDVVMEFKHTIRNLGGDLNIVHWIVGEHMRMKMFGAMRPAKKLELAMHKHFGLLMIFATQCDTMEGFTKESAAEFLNKLEV